MGIAKDTEFSLRPGPGMRRVAATLFALGFVCFFGARGGTEPLYLGWILSWTGLYVVLARYRVSRRRTQLALNDRAAETLDANRPLVLYLRPFMTSGRLDVVNPMQARADRFLLGKYFDAELAVSLALEGRAGMIAIGDTGKSVGAAKLVTEDERWRELLVRCAERALAIVVVPYRRPSTMWEVRYLFSRPELLGKTLFLMPPTYLRPYALRILVGRSPARMWKAAAAELRAQQIELPGYRRIGGWIRMDADSRSAREIFSFAGFEPTFTWVMLSLTGSNPSEARVQEGLRSMHAAGEKYEQTLREWWRFAWVPLGVGGWARVAWLLFIIGIVGTVVIQSY